MKVFLKILALILLLLNGTGAIYGGWHLINHPDGSSLKMTPDLLANTPFHNFLIPGIILFSLNGLFSVITLLLLVFNFRKYPLLIYIQGIMLTGWIVIQCILLQEINFLQITLGSVGLLLMSSGIILNRLTVFETRINFL
jgi:hypothetical protein